MPFGINAGIASAAPLAGAASLNRLRDQAATDVGLQPPTALPKQRSFFETLIARDKTAAERQGLLNAAAQFAGGQNGFASALGQGGAAFENTLASAAEEEARKEQEALLREQAAQQQAFQNEVTTQNQANADRRLGQQDRSLDLQEARDAATARRNATGSRDASFSAPQFFRDANGQIIAVQGSNKGGVQQTSLGGLQSFNSSADGKAKTKFQEDSRDRRQTASELATRAQDNLSIVNSLPEDLQFGPAGVVGRTADKAAVAAGIASPEQQARVEAANLLDALTTSQAFDETQKLKGAISNVEIGMARQASASVKDPRQSAQLKLELRLYQAERAEEREQFLSEAVNQGKNPEEALRLYDDALEDSGPDPRFTSILDKFGVNPNTDQTSAPALRDGSSTGPQAVPGFDGLTFEIQQ